MPTRFLRPGIRTSLRWNETSYSAQSLYISILTLVDDYGRFEAHPALIHAECRGLRQQMTADDSNGAQLPADDSDLRANAVNRGQTTADLIELENRGLIQIYKVDDVLYLQVARWKDRIRATASRYPDPPVKSRGQMTADDSNSRADDSNCPPSSPSPSPSPSPSEDSLKERVPSSSTPNCDDDLIQHAEAESVLREVADRLYGKKIGLWGQQPPIYDHYLNEALKYGLPRQQFEAFKWLYSLPADDPVVSGENWLTQRKQTFTILLANLADECEKALGVQKKYQAGLGDIEPIP